MSLSAAATVSTWVAFAVALLELLVGTATLARKQIIYPWMRDRYSWKVRGWADIFFGAFLLMETIPRLSYASVGFVLVCSVIAFIPMGLAIFLMVRSAHPARS